MRGSPPLELVPELVASFSKLSQFIWTQYMWFSSYENESRKMPSGQTNNKKCTRRPLNPGEGLKTTTCPWIKLYMVTLNNKVSYPLGPLIHTVLQKNIMNS